VLEIGSMYSHLGGFARILPFPPVIHRKPISMNEKTDNIIGEERIEQARGNESNLHQFGDDKVEHTVVFSVPLADALAKDKPSPWSAHMWKLYAIMNVVHLVCREISTSAPLFTAVTDL
jgi:hypothetical protein